MRRPAPPPDQAARAAGSVDVVDPLTGRLQKTNLYIRTLLAPGSMLDGPALIVEDETTTLVTGNFTAAIDAFGSIVMTRKR